MSKYRIDTDTASDDAVAFLIALRHISSQIVGMSTASGNVPAGQATKTRYTLRGFAVLL
ncbi:nucleoside hydrolase [Ruegeria sp. HKCCD7318]|uniref:nucleoside hydrolase n=1 Tax=Ruegeria sp. HKCCD7318 TaxID=2683014 RepID=UPI001490A987|nr:nucleoside hydrolase [Ruegeria sp. HKCCD7318]NOE36372.1 hypothetical protein [Ruegeria sp. HKCCD7318]